MASPALKQFAPFLTLGIQLAATVVILLFAGRWLDGMLHSSPWCTVVGTVVGVGGGLYKFILDAVRLGKQEDERWKNGKHDRERGS